MRVLFTTWAWPSHLYPMVPTARACHAAGHDVLVASQPELIDEIVTAGLPAAPVGQDVDAVGMVRGYLLPTAADPGTDEGTAPRADGGLRALAMFLAHAEAMLDDLVRLVREWQADVLVFEPTALAGPIAAAAAGIPAVRHLYGTDLLMRARRLMPDALRPLAARHGVSAFDPFGEVTIDPTPASFQLPVNYPRLPIQYVPFNNPGGRSLEPAGHTRRARVCVSWGYTMAKLDPSRFLAGQVVSALGELDVDMLAAVSGKQRTLLGSVPANTTVLTDAALHDVLPSCDLVISHGGAGTILTALSYGLPLLLVPQLPDHTAHAGRVVATGTGGMLTRDEATPEQIRYQVTRLLGDSPERVQACAMQAEIQRQPAPASVVTELERL